MRAVLRIFTLAAAFFETGVFLIIVSALFLTVLPVSAALLIGVYFAALSGRRNNNRRMEKALSGRKVSVFFPPRGTDFSPNTFFSGLCREFAEKGTVIVVSPYFISSRGFSRGAYLTCRRDDDNIYFCRSYAFFSLRRTVLKSLDAAYFY